MPVCLSLLFQSSYPTLPPKKIFFASFEQIPWLILGKMGARPSKTPPGYTNENIVKKQTLKVNVKRKQSIVMYIVQPVWYLCCSKNEEINSWSLHHAVINLFK